MGEAYLADDTLLHRQVVIKRMAPHLARNEYDRKRFLSEAKRAAAINNTHVVQIYDALEANSELLLVLEYVDGTSLRHLKRRRLELDEFFPIALQIADGVAAAHGAHVIHCDLKPDNVLITHAHVVKVLDFGLARPISRDDAATLSLTQPKFAGTPGYMAPEMIREQDLDERADIFAMGVIFYELLTGIPPFSCPTLLDTLQKTLHDEPPPVTGSNPLVPIEIDWVIGKMLAKSRDERYNSVREIITDLGACQRKLHDGTATTRLSVTPPPLPAKAKRNRVFAVIALVLAIAGPAYYVWQQSGSGTETSTEAQYRSVAVLPFHIIGDSQHGQAYADGICATLTSKLASIADAHQLHVTPASEVRRRSLTDATAAKQQLGADLVIEGQMQQMANAVRITYNLVDTHTITQVRSETIDGNMDDPFTLEDKIVNGALNMLNVQLEANERQSLGRRGTTNAAAYDLFLTGSGYLREYEDPGNLQRAIESLQGALLKDANYAQAHAALGRAYWEKYLQTHDPYLVDSAKLSCEAALKNDATLPDSHLCLGIVSAGHGELATAARELEQVVKAEPSNDVALGELATVYEKSNRPAEAEEVYKRAIKAQPHYWAGYANLGSFYKSQARYEESAAQFKQAIEQTPGNGLLYFSLGGVYIFQGKYDEAVQVLKKSVELQPDRKAYSNLGQAYLHVRQFDNAISAFKQAIALGARSYESYSGLGDAYYWSHTHREESAAAYTQSIRLGLEQQRINPKNPDTNIMLAYNSAAVGDETHAVEYLARAQEEAPNDAEIMFFAARIYARLNHNEKAAEWLQKAVAGNYSKADIRACPDLDALMTLPAIKVAMGR